MTKTQAAAVVASLFLASACSTSADRRHGASLTLIEPPNQSMVCGTTNEVMVAVRRHDCAGPISIAFDGLPDGVSLVEADATLGADDDVIKLTLKAEAGARIVPNHYVSVVARGPEGVAAYEGFRLSVAARP